MNENEAQSMMTDMAAEAGSSEQSSALTESELTAVAGGIVYFGPIWKRDPRPTPPQPLPPPPTPIPPGGFMP